MIRILFTIALLCLAGCGPVPGGSLSGTAAPVPADWSSLMADKTICEIQSRPDEPHSIQLECFLFNNALYVQSHRWVNARWWPGESWAIIWQKQPAVTVRIKDALYSLRANVEMQHRDTILKQRGYDPVPDGIVVFRFEPSNDQDS